MEKIQLRQQLLAQRRALSQAEQSLAAQRLYEVLISTEIFQQANVIGFYYAINGEVSVESLLQTALSQEKTCCLPVVTPGDWLLYLPYKIGDRLMPSQYEILEPELNPDRVVPLQEIDLILVPLVGVTASGIRLGMGGGCFDRTFAYKIHQPKVNPCLIGVGYQFQKINKLRCNDWDVVCDQVYLV